MWGNPLYRWTYLFFRRYDWWVERMRGMSKLYDIVRVDHFIGFANYYSIPYGAPNARSGKWIVGPGKKLFRRLKKELPNLRVVAEDLGVQSDRVRELLKFVGYPGMKVATFGFGGDADGNQHFPGNWSENYVAYTGTHDNDTTAGWIATADETTLKAAKDYLHFGRHGRRRGSLHPLRAVLPVLHGGCADAGRAASGQRSPHEPTRHHRRQLGMAHEARRRDGGCCPPSARNESGVSAYLILWNPHYQSTNIKERAT